jgi:NDP-sugar pyrophosphorylase family protein
MSIQTAVVFAGGLGTRLSTISSGIPKVLMEIEGKPFIYWKVRQLLNQGIDEIFLLTGLGHLEVEEYLYSSEYKRFITCIKDPTENCGTGAAFDAIRSNLNKTFVVTYGDSLMNMNLAELEDTYAKSDLPVLAVTKELDSNMKFNAKLEQKMIKAYRKQDPDTNSNCIDYGYFVSSIENIPQFSIDVIQQKYDFDLVFDYLSKTNNLSGYLTKEKYFEIGTPHSFESTKKRWKQIKFLQ